MNSFIKNVCLFIILTLTPFCTQAQDLQEVVYLKNGSVIRGIIIEQIPNSSLKIKTADGSIFAYKMADVEKIAKEAMQINQHKGKLPNNNPLTAGYRGFVDLGYTIGTGTWAEDRIEFATSHGYQFNHYLYTGLGAGIHYYFNSDVIEIPIFTHIRSEFLSNAISPFIDFKIGYTVFDSPGFYMTPSLGCRFAFRNNGGISIGIGYTMQKLTYYYYNYYDSFSSKENCGGFSIKIGFDF